MRAILLGDVHLADRPPSVRTEDYADLIIGKLRFSVQTAIEEKVDALILAGDVFHIKRPDRTSHALVQRALDTFTEAQKAGIEVMAVPGNHDMQHDRLDSLEKQPLGVLFKSGVKPLMGRHPHLPVHGIPYLQDWGDLHGWLGTDETVGQSPIDTRTLVVTHAPIMPPGRSAPFEYIDATHWANAQGAGRLYYGHIHDTHGAFRAGDEGLGFCNQGALSRGSLHESDLQRKPAITLYDTDGDEESCWRRIEVPHRPASEVYTLTQVRSAEHNREQMSEFIRRIGSVSINTISIEALSAHLATLDIPADVKSAVLELVEEATCS
jgi:predicted phosphodiesterase